MPTSQKESALEALVGEESRWVVACHDTDDSFFTIARTGQSYVMTETIDTDFDPEDWHRLKSQEIDRQEALELRGRHDDAYRFRNELSRHIEYGINRDRVRKIGGGLVAYSFTEEETQETGNDHDFPPSVHYRMSLDQNGLFILVRDGAIYHSHRSEGKVIENPVYSYVVRPEDGTFGRVIFTNDGKTHFKKILPPVDTFTGHVRGCLNAMNLLDLAA